MDFRFLKELENKPYEVRYRIFWFIMSFVVAIGIVGWLFLIKSHQPSGNNGYGFQVPPYNEIIPPEVRESFKVLNGLGNLSNGNFNNNFSNNFNINNSPVIGNEIGNTIISNTLNNNSVR